MNSHVNRDVMNNEPPPWGKHSVNGHAECLAGPPVSDTVSLLEERDS